MIIKKKLSNKALFFPYKKMISIPIEQLSSYCFIVSKSHVINFISFERVISYLVVHNYYKMKI